MRGPAGQGHAQRRYGCKALSQLRFFVPLCCGAQAEAGGSLPPDVGEALGALRQEQQGLEQELAQR